MSELNHSAVSKGQAYEDYGLRAARGGMRSVVEAYERDGFLEKEDVRLVASYVDGSFLVATRAAARTYRLSLAVDDQAYRACPRPFSNARQLLAQGGSSRQSQGCSAYR